MKKGLLLALTILAVAGCTSCEKEAEPTCPPPPESKVVDYTGAILPLTAGESKTELCVQRELELDFSGWDAETGIAVVKDDYVLANPSDEALELELYYPIASCWEEWNPAACKVSVDSEPIDHEVYTARPDQNQSGSLNLHYGKYDDAYFVGEGLTHLVETCYSLERVFESTPDLSQITGYRYRITDIRYDSVLPMPREAAICVEYDWEYSQEKFQPSVGEYGFSRTACGVGEDSSQHCQFMVLVEDAQDAVMFTTTKEIDSFILRGYSRAEFDPEYELPKLTARLEVEQLPLSVILEDVIDHYIKDRSMDAEREQYQKEVLNRIEDEFLLRDGTASYASMEAYLGLTPETERIFWLEIPVVIGGGEKAELSVQYEKIGGTELGGPAARSGVRHYDILPSYGTSLTLQEQFIVLTGHDGISVQTEELANELIRGITPDAQFYHFSIEAED